MKMLLHVFRLTGSVDCPAFAVDGSTQGSWAASPTGTTTTIECAVNHILMGSATLTCGDDRSWLSDKPRCDHKTGKCTAVTIIHFIYFWLDNIEKPTTLQTII